MRITRAIVLLAAFCPVVYGKGISMNITKAVIPAAGLGTRFLPFTKSIPKEMLTLLDENGTPKPALHHIIEEGLASGISNVYIITNDNKHEIKHYFEPDPQLEAELEKRGKKSLLSEVDRIIKSVNFTYIQQLEQLGLGHAILMAKKAIGTDYFGVMLPDDIIAGDNPGLAQLIKVAEKEQASVIAVQEVPQQSVSSYGIIAIKKKISDRLFEIDTLVEKPALEDAPSNLAITGRYVLSPKIFASLEVIKPGAGGELQLTDAIADMLNKGERVFAYKFEGRRFDIGTPLGWLEANIYYGLQNPKYASIIKKSCP